RLPMEQKFSLDGPPEARGSKLVLRRAFADLVPPEVLSRPKASFPLPFDRWSAPVTAGLMSSEFLREVVSRETLADVVRRPTERWQLAWLLGNLALFGEVALGAPAAPTA
ncbi:MAG: asparagine synthase-related protein, partial [Planctomycetota bacterium]|nr:asparagine synthase-related protein [Planctomycetota bacterium]